MDDARGVSSLERHRYLNPDAKDFIKFQWMTPETVSQGFAFDVLGSDIVVVIRFADLVDSENVG